MVDLYKIEKDKYGLYYVSYGKKHRIKTLEKRNKELWEKIQDLYQYAFFDNEYLENEYNQKKINYKIITINDKQYIQFGGGC